MQRELPLFPLSVVLFPGRPLSLHIFETRYRQMLADCIDGDHRFGVVAIRSGHEVGRDATCFDVGTIAEIEDVRYFEDGRADVVTRGIQRFKVLTRLAAQPYPRAVVTPCVDQPVNGAVREPAGLLRRMLGPYLAGLGAPEELLRRLPEKPEELAWLAASAVQVDLPEQQRLLEIDSVPERILATIRTLRRETCIMRHLGTVASLKPAGPGGAELN
jgi:uncharacterized protein